MGETSSAEKWLLRLKGGESELHELGKLDSHADWRVVELEGRYYLTSREFDSLEDAREVHDRARRLLRLIAGAAKIVDPFLEPIEVAGVERVEKGRPPTQFIFPEPIVVELRVPAPTVVTSGGLPTSYLAPVGDIVGLANRDEHVAIALHFWGAGPQSWHSLYKIFENIQVDVKSRIWREGWASHADVNRFTQTAQSMEAVGDEARHSLRKYAPPPRPMSLREAQSLVGQILDKWLRFRGALGRR